MCWSQPPDRAATNLRRTHVRSSPTRRQISTASAARAEGLSKFYGSGDAAVAALDDVSVGVVEGQFTAIMGPSGSGKSTLLHMLAGLDRPTSGEVYLGDTEITSLNDKALTLLRRDRIGFIFQSFNLLPTMTAAENIVLPMRIAGRKPDEHWVASIVETVGLTGRLAAPARRSSPVDSSSGSPRRGRSRPSPRSCSRTSRPVPWTPGPVPSCSRSSARRSSELGQTVVMVTHDPTAASYADRVIFLADGHIVDEMHAATADEVLDYMKHLGA